VEERLARLHGDGRMIRYFRLWLSFFKASWMADLEYRMNIVVRVFSEFVWYVLQLSVFEVLYLHADSISGWDVRAMRVFMGTFFLVDNIYIFFFQDNMDALNGIARKGDLDLYLTKPVNSQFMISMRKVATAYTLNTFFILIYLIWGVSQLPHPISFWQILSFVYLLVCGLACYYAMRFMLIALVIVLEDAGNVAFIWGQIFRLGSRPDPIYPTTMRLLMFTVLPVAFMASVPARVLVEGVDPLLLLAATAMSAALVYLSHRFWNGALRHYSSASS
jgi:ABC-2 type transport system permease protein